MAGLDIALGHDLVRKTASPFRDHALAAGHASRIAAANQLPDPESTSPKSCQVAPSNFISCICLIGAKSVSLDAMMPGSSIGNFRSWIEAACFMTLSRVRLSP